MEQPGAIAEDDDVGVAVAVIVGGHGKVARQTSRPDAFAVGAVRVVEVPGSATLQGEVDLPVAIVVGRSRDAARVGLASPDRASRFRGGTEIEPGTTAIDEPVRDPRAIEIRGYGAGLDTPRVGFCIETDGGGEGLERADGPIDAKASSWIVAPYLFRPAV